MKKSIIGLFILGFVLQSFAQQSNFENRLKNEKVPAELVQSIQELVSEKFGIVASNVAIKNMLSAGEGTDGYEVSLKSANRHVKAVFDRDGMLVSSSEKYKNKALPSEVRNGVAKSYPGWSFEQNDFKVITSNGKILKEEYNITLKNGTKFMDINTDHSGNITKSKLRNAKRYS